MGVNMDKLVPRPFQRGGVATIGPTQSRIREQANNAKAQGQKQINAFEQLTATGGVQPQKPEMSTTQVNQTAPVSQQLALPQKYAGEVLRTHRKLIDDLVDHIMFG